jgi:hypothetical protein
MPKTLSYTYIWVQMLANYKLNKTLLLIIDELINSHHYFRQVGSMHHVVDSEIRNIYLFMPVCRAYFSLVSLLSSLMFKEHA